MRNKIYQDVFFFLLLFAAFSLMVIYISEATLNCPIMDYWSYLNILVDKSYMGEVTFYDLYSNNGVHRTPLQLFLFLVNIHLFHWNTQISMYLGAFITAIFALAVYFQIKKLNCKRKLSMFFSAVCVIVVTFSLSPFEIITQEFFTSFALRVLFFWGGYIWFDSVLRDISKPYFDNKLLLFLVYNLITICLLGAAYSIAYSIAIVSVGFFVCVYKKIKHEFINYKNIICIFTGIIIADFLYVHGLYIDNSKKIYGSLFALVTDFIKGLIIFSGAGVVGSSASITKIYIGGCVLLLLNLISVITYFRHKLFNNSFIPLLLYIYWGTFYGMIFFARGGMGVYYLASSRYIVDTEFCLIANIIVWAMYYDQIDVSKENITKSIISITLMLCIIPGIILADSQEFRMRNNRKIYVENLVTMMGNIDEYSDEELYPFQANGSVVRTGVDIMKKYKLGIFRNGDEDIIFGN